MKDGLEMEQEQNIPKIESVILGLNRELYAELPTGMKKAATDKVCIFYDNKTAEIIDLTGYSQEEKIEEMNNINELINNSIIDRKKYQSLYSDSKAFERVEKKAENMLEGKDYSTLKKIGAVAGIVLGAAVLGTSCGAILDNLNNKKIEEESNKTPDMTGKDLAFYTENALETGQKDLMLKNITTWLEDVNAEESWMKTTLTEEQMKMYGLTESESIFGFTAEDAYSLALRFGHYSLDEYVTITGGKEIDTVAVMDDALSQSNGALANIVSYYICSDDCDLNIEALINFNEKEIAQIDAFEADLREFKALIKEGKEKEAEEKMREIKSSILEYAHDVDYEQNNAKSYILRTFVPACSALSQIYQYTDTVELELYDTQNDENTTKEIKTALFDEVTMRTLVLGFDECTGVGAFDAEAYLEEHNISPSRYNLLNTDITSSIADQSVSGQVEKLEQANIYIANLRNDDITAETSFMGANIKVDLNKGNIGDQVAMQMDNYNNVLTTYDELTYGTYEPEILLEMINNHLKANNIYPKNMDYFRSEKLAEISIEYKDNNGVTAGKKGDTIDGGHQEDVNIDDEEIGEDDKVLDDDGNETTEEDAKEEAEEEYDEENDIKDDEEAEEEAITYQQFLQGVYNATFNHVYGSAVVVDGFDTSNTYGLTYTDEWARHSDPMVVNKYNKAVQQALAYKEAQEHDGELTGGEEIIEDEYKETDVVVDEEQPIDEEEKEDEDVKEDEDDGYSDEEPEDYSPVVTEVSEEQPVTVEETEVQEDGYSDQAPEGFAPVVDDSIEAVNGDIVYFSEEDLMNYISTEEGNAWFESVTSSETVDTNEVEKTK